MRHFYKKTIAAVFFLLSLFAGLSSAQEKTVINDVKAKNMLLEKHMFSLQWISWDYFGSVTVTNKDGVYYLNGKQKGRGNTDFVEIDGVITQIDAKQFKFDGKITTQVSHINNGEPCMREGIMTFAITKNRKYWRLQEMNNPCDEVVDYVDIFFR